MKKNTGFILIGTLSLLFTAAVALHGCGSNDGAAAPPAPKPAKFTIVGAGN